MKEYQKHDLATHESKTEKCLEDAAQQHNSLIERGTVGLQRPVSKLEAVHVANY